jgi:peroxiredoxin
MAPFPSMVERFGVGSARAFAIKAGSPIPNVSLDKGFPPQKINLPEFTKGKKVVLVGLPGAFTPT